MALTTPEDKPLAEAAAIEFAKLCEARGLKNLTIIQASILVGVATIEEEAAGDHAYTKELLERYIRSFTTAVLSSNLLE